MKSTMKGTVTRCMESLQKHLNALHFHEKAEKRRNAKGKLTKDIASMHLLCYGNAERDPHLTRATKLISRLLDPRLNDNLLLNLIQNIKYLEFEAKKQVADILNYALRRASRNKSHHYIQQHTDTIGYNPIISVLLNEYENMHSTLYEMVKRPELTHMFLNKIKIRHRHTIDYQYNRVLRKHSSYLRPLASDRAERSDYDFVDALFSMADTQSFTESSHAYKTLYHLLINGNKKYVTSYILAHSEAIFRRINKLIQKEQFVKQKQFLSLLRDLLLNKGNHTVLIRYLSSKENLVNIMRLMKKYERSSISMDAYHIFKIFIVNPKKEKRVNVTLWKNKKRLIELLSGFHDDKARDDPQFDQDRSNAIDMITDMELHSNLN